MQHTEEWNEMFTNIQIRDFFNYMNIMEESIESHKDLLADNFQEASQGYDEDSVQELFENVYLEEYQDLDHTFSLILRKSLFITLYSFMETELYRLAKNIESQDLTKINLKDIGHKGLQQYLFYLETVNDIEINISTSERKEFLKYNALRNHFVHQDNFSFKLKQYEQLKSIPGLSFKQYDDPQSRYPIESLSKEFNENYLELISRFFDEFYKGIGRGGFSL